MKKRGFTLAEVLITLGIIGVVAALTTPALVKNSGQAKIGPSLAKFVNTFETATERYMAEESISSLSNGAQVAGFVNHMSMTLKDNSYTYTFTDAQGHNEKQIQPKGAAIDVLNCMAMVVGHEIPAGCEDMDYTHDGQIGVADFVTVLNIQAASGTGNGVVLVLKQKDGAVICVEQIVQHGAGLVASAATEGHHVGTYQGAVAKVIYDIDGDRAVGNKAGRDVFAFYLDASGTLIPYGSNIYKAMRQNIDTAAGEQQFGSFYDAAYSNSTHCSLNGGLANNFACTGDIADHNWKAKYN